jgi:hypothetical protein
MKPIVCTIKENAWLAKIASRQLKSRQAAIVIGRTIYLYGVTGKAFMENIPWLRHEACHIRQYNRYRIKGFLFLYLFEYVRFGYYNNCFEKEARAAETNPAMLDNITFTIR